MYRKIFPKCSVTGAVDPVPFNHMGLHGSVPRKCSKCRFQFEGGCTRAMEQVHGYLLLDHGPCPVKGETSPILYENSHIQSKVFVPKKCAACRHLGFSFHAGFSCKLDAEKWGAFPRALDWGAWAPEHPTLGLSSGRSVPLGLLLAVKEQDEAAGVRAFRQAFPDSTIREARDAFAELTQQFLRGGG
ncbi:hypothetical protein [Undibacterium rugosum]|uniref:hypothetical protein n=1 Tax=Undibacterium rugosum TaxID=2762291 RepID=UPI001B829C1B|nr:hypothetical protein [Undibacterium rugosum]MBR7780426.1 hypothetical protein [Undibacterium rugosum]